MISFMFWNIMLCSGDMHKKNIWLWYPTKKNYLALISNQKKLSGFNIIPKKISGFHMNTNKLSDSQ